jgi:hypothetical protein
MLARTSVPPENAAASTNGPSSQISTSLNSPLAEIIATSQTAVSNETRSFLPQDVHIPQSMTHDQSCRTCRISSTPEQVHSDQHLEYYFECEECGYSFDSEEEASVHEELCRLRRGAESTVVQQAAEWRVAECADEKMPDVTRRDGAQVEGHKCMERNASQLEDLAGRLEISRLRHLAMAPVTRSAYLRTSSGIDREHDSNPDLRKPEEGSEWDRRENDRSCCNDSNIWSKSVGIASVVSDLTHSTISLSGTPNSMRSFSSRVPTAVPSPMISWTFSSMSANGGVGWARNEESHPCTMPSLLDSSAVEEHTEIGECGSGDSLVAELGRLRLRLNASLVSY